MPYVKLFDVITDLGNKYEIFGNPEYVDVSSHDHFKAKKPRFSKLTTAEGYTVTPKGNGKFLIVETEEIATRIN